VERNPSSGPTVRLFVSNFRVVSKGVSIVAKDTKRGQGNAWDVTFCNMELDAAQRKLLRTWDPDGSQVSNLDRIERLGGGQQQQEVILKPRVKDTGDVIKVGPGKGCGFSNTKSKVGSLSH